MRLRFLGAPRVSKSSHPVVDAAAAHKVEPADSAEAKTVSPSTSANDAASVRQLRQRRVGVGLWAIRRQKLERAQLRPRIVVRMSRLRGRRTPTEFAAVSLCKKRKPRHSSLADDGLCTVTTDGNNSPDITEVRSGSNVVADPRMDTANRFKLEQPEENGVRDDIDNSRVRDKDSDQKPPEDAVNLRPKRHIMHKNLVSTCYCVTLILSPLIPLRLSILPYPHKQIRIRNTDF